MKTNIKVSTRTNGIWLTVAAMVLGLGVIIAMAATASESDTAIGPLMLFAGAMHVGFLVLGSARWMAAASAPLLAAVVIESGLGDDPSWVRAIVLGCCWFVAIELSWEAIDRRSGARYTTAATLRRLQEVVTVVGVALVIGLIAASATTFAPVRSVALQAVVLGVVLAAFVSLVRHVLASGPNPQKPNLEKR